MKYQNGEQKVTTGEVFLVLVGFALLTLAYFKPMVLDPDAVWSVGRDFFQNNWNLWWVDQAVEQGKPLLETDRMFAPEGTSLAMHTISFTNSLPGVVLQQGLGLSLATTHTVLFLSAFVLSGFGGWALLRYLTGSPIGAFAGGVLYAFNPYHTAMITQLNNVQFQWLPLFLLGVMWIVDKKSNRAILFTAVMLALCGYTDWYQPILAALAALVLVLVRLRGMKNPRDLGIWLRLGVAAVLGGLMLLPGILPLLSHIGGGDSELEDPIRYIGEVQLSGMSPNGLGAHFAWPVLLGWTTCLMVVYTLFRVREKGVGLWWWLTIVAFLLLQGPYLVVMNQHFPQIPMPMAVFPHVPVLDMVRVPHRFLILLMLGLAGLYSYGLREFQVQRGWVMAFLTVPLLALELQPVPPRAIHLSRAPVYQQAALEDADTAVLELPMDFRDGYTMWLQTHHGKKLVAGYTSHILPEALPGLETELMRSLLPAQTDTDVLGLPQFQAQDLEQINQDTLQAWRMELLQDKNVRFIVFHRRADFTAPSGRPHGPSDQMGKLKEALTPYRLNDGIRRGPLMRRFVVKQFQENLAAESAQARALVELMFGPPDRKLGNLTTEVWDLRDEAEALLSQAEEGR